MKRPKDLNNKQRIGCGGTSLAGSSNWGLPPVKARQEKHTLLYGTTSLSSLSGVYIIQRDFFWFFESGIEGSKKCTLLVDVHRGKVPCFFFFPSLSSDNLVFISEYGRGIAGTAP